MTKYETIQWAYGNNKVVVDENGWVKRKVTGHGVTNGMDVENFPYERKDFDVILQDASGGYSWRLKSLRGIENNNGWTKIESTDDLPKEQGFYNFIKINGDLDRAFFSPGLFEKQTSEYYTHWRPISDIPKPIY